MPTGFSLHRLLGQIASDSGGEHYDLRLDWQRAAARLKDETPIKPDWWNRTNLKSKEFRQWFDGSVLITADGRPRLFYHGTSADFVEFSTECAVRTRPTGGNSFFFTGDRARAAEYGLNVMTVCLHMRNPLVLEAGANKWAHYGPGTGYDGAIFNHGDPILDEYMVSNPAQIRLIRRERGKRQQ